MWKTLLTILKILLVVGYVVLTVATYPSIGSIVLIMGLIMAPGIWLWQRFINR